MKIFKSWIILLFCVFISSCFTSCSDWTYEGSFKKGGLSYVIYDGAELRGAIVTGCKEGVKKIEIPSTIYDPETKGTYPVVGINNDAFDGCRSLTSVTIPNSVIAIGERAFSNCESLTSINIPNSVTTIRDWTFFYCFSLKEVHCYAKTPPTLGDNVFPETGVPKLYVPKGTRQAYVLSIWGRIFKEIIEMNE